MVKYNECSDISTCEENIARLMQELNIVDPFNESAALAHVRALWDDLENELLEILECASLDNGTK